MCSVGPTTAVLITVECSWSGFGAEATDDKPAHSGKLCAARLGWAPGTGTGEPEPGAGVLGVALLLETGMTSRSWSKPTWRPKNERSNSHHGPKGDGTQERTTPVRSTAPFRIKRKRPRRSK
mmetsp:Transcript_25973/g.47647  ORF Transcript_25973/g.47647 Transcript_25973/m.47647 type:complete len:122 (+) Transcript_25973:481-846(+)